MNIKEWQVVGNSENFTVLGLGDDGKIYYYKDGEWKVL